MGIFGDFKEYTKGWKKKPLYVKIIGLFAVFFMASSITSLADHIFKWRGFIIEGIEFYRDNIIGPIRELFSFLNITYNQDAIDVLMVINIMIGSFWRGLNFSGSSINGKKKYGKFKVVLGLLFISMILTSAWIVQGMDYEVNIPILIFMCTSFTLLPLLGFTNSKLKIKPFLLRFWTPIIIAIVTVLVLAAINEGFTRTL